MSSETCHICAHLQDQSPNEKAHLTTVLQVQQLMAVNGEEHTAQNYVSNVTGSIQKKVNILYRHLQLSWSHYRCINKCKATGQKNYLFLVFQVLPSWPFLNHRTESLDWLHARQGSLRISAILMKVYLLLWSGQSQFEKLPFHQFSRLSLGNKNIKILVVVNSRNVAALFRASFLLSSY